MSNSMKRSMMQVTPLSQRSACAFATAEDTMPTTSATATTSTRQHVPSNRRRIKVKRRRDITTTIIITALTLAVGCCSKFFCCVAFNIARHPFSTGASTINKASFRLHATTRAERYISLSSSSSSPQSSSSSRSSPSSRTTYDRNEFEMQVGKAMDTLRDDYPDILVKDPDYSIYHSDLELIDPSGVHLYGVKNYENAFRLVHAIIGIFYCPERSGLTFRMCFDKARQNIRIHWNAKVIPKAIFGGYKTTLHVDGISIYELDRISGNITQHRLERLVMNDDYVTPEQGIFAALRRHAIKSQVDGVPALNTQHGQMEASATGIGSGSNNRNKKCDGKFHIQTNNVPNHILQFKNKMNPFLFSSRGSILFGVDDNDDDNDPSASKSFTTASSSRLYAVSSSSNPSDKDCLAPSHMDMANADALEKKNSVRRKFGLKPLSMEEYLELQDQVAELDSMQKEKAAAAAVELDRAKQQKESSGGFFDEIFGNAMKDTCESNYDCDYPEVCCDFRFKKMCCSSGMRILNGPSHSQGQLAEVPVPIYNPNPYPPNDPRNRDN